MKDHKSWYEKISIWITIIAGICAILGISVFGNDFFNKGDDTNEINLNFDNTGSEDHSSNYSYNDYTIQGDDSYNTIIENQYNMVPDIQEDSLEEFVTEPYDTNILNSLFSIEVKVRKVDDEDWSNQVNINIGDEIEFKIEYKNTSEYDQKDVIVFDILPQNVKYVEGTSKLYNSHYPTGEKINPDDLFSSKGLNIGNYKPGTNVTIYFMVEIIDIELVDGIRTLANEVHFQVGTEEQTISENYAYRIKHGWGPDRETYTNEHPADHPVFNSLTDNLVLGDERDFVRIVELRDAENDEKNYYVNSLEIEPGKRYGVFIYYHNNAASKYNEAENNYSGIAWNTRIASAFPSSLVKGEKSAVYGRISSTSTDPESVWDSAEIIAKEDMTLHFVVASAKIHNNWGASDSVLSTNLFSNKGTLIGQDKLNGMIFADYEYSGFITYTIEARAIEESN